MKIIILGGGFLGQLIHTLIPRARVFDWRPEPPKVPARQLGPQYLWEPLPHLPCREFDVFTTVDGEEATPDRILAYKKKVGKELDNSDWLAQFRYHMKGYDPMLPADRVEYGRRVLQIRGNRLEMADGKSIPFDVLVSTIPLNHLRQMAGLNGGPPFRYSPIFVRTQYHSMDTNHPMYVDYVSNEKDHVYRITLREGKRYEESLQPNGGDWTKILPGKIYADQFVPRTLAELESRSIHCFGRFARWEPDELAHETFRQVSSFVKELP